MRLPLFGLIMVTTTAVTPNFAWTQEPAATTTEPYRFEANRMVAMRDGVELATHLYLPVDEGRYPTILMRTPYGKPDRVWERAKTYVAAGYAMAIQDCRGRGQSAGTWDPFLDDARDGFDTQEWIGRQPWSNGEIGTAGGSYLGWTQWAAAPNASQHLKAMVPIVPFGDAYDIAYSGGAFQMALLFGWGTGVGGIQLTPDKLGAAFQHLPLQNWDAQFERDVFFMDDWVEHPTYDKYWRSRGIQHRYSEVKVPVLNIGGWYDIFSKTTIDLVDRVRSESKHRMVRRNQFVVMGPWAHGVGKRRVGQLDFGAPAALNLAELQMKWFDYWLKGRATGVEDWPAYYLFVMGANRWRAEHEWPLARTEFTPFYLLSDGQAGTLGGHLSADRPGQTPPDTFVYDPRNPVPTVGGNNLVGASTGPYDQRHVERRADVLVYSTTPLLQPVEVTGPIKVTLFASSTAVDTDFTAKLVDVHPDGRAYNLCDGIVRARYRDAKSDAKLITPGEVNRYEIDLWVTSNLFQAGHQIRVEVSSSNFPRFNRNPNTGKPFGSDTSLEIATQTIYHDPGRASHILLPIVPQD